MNGREWIISNFKGLALVKAIKNIPVDVSILHLSVHINKETTAGLIKAFATIPDNVHTLNLWVNEFNIDNQTDPELALVLVAIPASVTYLCLFCNFHSNKTDAQLAQILAAIPTSVTSLNLHNNRLGRYTNLAQAFKTLHAGINYLDLSHNELGELNGDALTRAIAAIPASVIFLKLCSNLFELKTSTELIRAFAAIPAGVVFLDLRDNFYGKTGTELALILAAISVNVESIDLSCNYLGDKTVDELAQILAALPKGVTSVNLSRNEFNRKRGAELAQVFPSIPAGVTSLNLSYNNLGIPNSMTFWSSCFVYLYRFFNLPYNFQGITLGINFASIPSSVTSLDLKGNHLEYLSVEDIRQLNGSLSGVQTIYLSQSELQAMTIDKRIALKAVFPNIKNIIIVNAEGEALGGKNMEACHFFASKFGLTKEPPTLKSQISFFARYNYELNHQIKKLPNEVQNFVNSF